MSDVGGLAPQLLAVLASGFAGEDSDQRGLTTLCRVAVSATGASAAAAFYVLPGRGRAVVGTDDQAVALHRIQLATERGPAVEAQRSGEPVVFEDAGVLTERWRAFATAFDRSGFRSAWSVPLEAAGTRLGALGVLDTRPGPVPPGAVACSQALADLAAAMMACSRRERQAVRLSGQLQLALDTRVVIEQAKGRIAERHRLTPEAAFERLRAHARDRNLRLHGVAAAVARGDLVL